MNIPDWITLDEPSGKADCSVCSLGVTAPLSFGGIPRSTVLATFVVQHATHAPRRGFPMPTGLTSTGMATKAAREVLSR